MHICSVGSAAVRLALRLFVSRKSCLSIYTCMLERVFSSFSNFTFSALLDKLQYHFPPCPLFLPSMLGISLLLNRNFSAFLRQFCNTILCSHLFLSTNLHNDMGSKPDSQRILLNVTCLEVRLLQQQSFFPLLLATTTTA